MREPKPAAKKAGDKAKADRLAAALRANLKRRKAQARAKGDPTEKPAPTADRDEK